MEINIWNPQHDQVENDHEWSCSYDSIVKFYGNKYLRSTTWQSWKWPWMVMMVMFLLLNSMEINIWDPQHDQVENDHEWSCSYDSIVKFYGNKYLRSTTWPSWKWPWMVMFLWFYCKILWEQIFEIHNMTKLKMTMNGHVPMILL